MFLTSSGKEKIDYLVISGGCAQVEGIHDLLNEELGIHTVIANPFSQMKLSSSIDEQELNQTASQYMVAAGLALRSFSSWHI
jgi:type IV pilus assembly protein PilM